MDDLDKLLLNVDNEVDFKTLKEDEIRTHEKTVRKGDRNIGDEQFDNNSSDSFESLFEKLKEKKEIQLFSENHLNGLKPHWNHIIDFKNILSDLTLPDPVIFALRKHKYNLLRSIENIERIYEDFITTQSYQNIEKIAKQDYPRFFPAMELDHQRMQFLILKEIFLRLREVNSHIRKEWKDLASNIKVMTLANESGAFVARCEDIIRNGINCCKDADLFLEFLAAILYIPRKDFDVLEKDIINRIYFRDSYDYDYKSQFKLEPSVKPRNSNTQQESKNNKNHDKKIALEESTGHSEKDNQGHNVNPEITEKIRNLYRVPGKSSWNTKEPYIIKIDPVKLDHNINDLKSSIVFIPESKSHEAVDALVKRAMIRSMHAEINGITIRYEEFIFKTIIKLVQNITSTYKEICEDMDLFIYHCAPMTVYNILLRRFHKESIGVIFKKISKLKIARILPSEYIKSLVMVWFNENVHTKELPYDRILDFNQIKTELQNRYNTEIENHLKKIKIAVEHHREKTGVILDKNVILHKRAFDLFNDIEVEVYLRFLDKTIFRK